MELGFVEQLLIACCRHPFGPRQMILPTLVCALWLFIRVEEKDNAGYLLPFGAGGVRVEEPSIGEEMPFVAGHNLFRPDSNVCKSTVKILQVRNSPSGEYSGGAKTRVAVGEIMRIIMRSNKIREWHPSLDGYSGHTWAEYEEIRPRNRT
jgi:hypothetical protein